MCTVAFKNRAVLGIFLRNLSVMKVVHVKTDYVEVSKEELNSDKYKNVIHASHCMIYAINNGKIKLDSDEYDAKANILMQLRYDGYVGFPGGLVDEGENAEEAVAREIEEEMATDKKCFKVGPEDHIITHYSPNRNIVVHLFAKEVSLDVFTELEERSLKCGDYGGEVMGVLRIPLYTMHDGFGGFPAFLYNHFIGNSKEQLLYVLVARGIMTEDEINKALTANRT